MGHESAAFEIARFSFLFIDSLALNSSSNDPEDTFDLDIVFFEEDEEREVEEEGRRRRRRRRERPRRRSLGDFAISPPRPTQS